MIPIVAGLALGTLMGGGIAALQKKDILQGALMGAAGGALGGAFMPAAGGIGAAAPEVGTQVATQGLMDGVTGAVSSGGVGIGGLPTTVAEKMAMSGVTGGTEAAALAGTPSMQSLAGANMPSTGMFGDGIGNFISANKYPLLGGVAGGMMAPGEKPPSPEQGNIRDYTFSQTQNPNFGAPGEDYFSKQSYAPGAVTPVEDYNKADGGIIALADGGEIQRYTQPQRTMDPAVAAYNAQMMERANQQYNINPRPGPNQVPGSVGYVAPRMATPASAGIADDSISGLLFNPITQRFEGEFKAPGTKKKKMGDYDFEDLDARYARNEEQYNHATGDGNANGGLMSSYAEGGISDLGSYSDGGRLLKGPGDGVSDSIPAQIGAKQPARLADGEFVVPARTVSELGNGSTDAGAKQLYAMMDRVQKARKRTTGKGKVAVTNNPRKLLPA